MNRALLEDVLRRLEAIEPDLPSVAALGPDLPEVLDTIVATENPRAAGGALGVAALLGDRAMAAIGAGVARREGEVRSAAAAALRSVPRGTADPLLQTLAADRDPAVRKWAVRAIGAAGSASLSSLLVALSENDPFDAVRDEARRAAGLLSALA